MSKLKPPKGYKIIEKIVAPKKKVFRPNPVSPAYLKSPPEGFIFAGRGGTYKSQNVDEYYVCGTNSDTWIYKKDNPKHVNWCFYAFPKDSAIVKANGWKYNEDDKVWQETRVLQAKIHALEKENARLKDENAKIHSKLSDMTKILEAF